MDHADRRFGGVGFAGLSGRVRALSPSRLPVPGPGIRGLALIAVAIGLGIWAQSMAEGEAIRRWKRDHAPGRELWERSLGFLGFVRLNEIEKAHRVLRTLPSTLDLSPTAWTDADRRWVAVYEAHAEDPEVRLYYRRRRLPGPPSAPRADGWRWAGVGWDGFEEALRRIEPPLDESAPAPRLRRPVRDPREIRY
jgi:hypothetical protein